MLEPNPMNTSWFESTFSIALNLPCPHGFVLRKIILRHVHFDFENEGNEKLVFSFHKKDNKKYVCHAYAGNHSWMKKRNRNFKLSKIIDCNLNILDFKNENVPDLETLCKYLNTLCIKA